MHKHVVPHNEMNLDIEKFPTHKKTIKSIERLKKLEWPKLKKSDNINDFVEKVQDLIQTEFEFLPNIFKFIEHKNFGLPIYRVRELNSFTNINLFSEHSYPPINLVGFGRCNFPNFPVFYCSDNPMISLLEVVRENNYKGKKYCISKWELKNPEEKLAFQTFIQTDLHPDNNFNFLKNEENEQLKEPLDERIDLDKQAGIVELTKYLQSIFINDNTYELSASLAHRTLYAKHNYATDVLIYPSKQSAYKGINMAIHPNFVDNNLIIKRFYIVELKNIDKSIGKFDITFSEYATIEKNVIMWKKLKPEDEKYKVLLMEDFKSVITPDFEWKFEHNTK
jgi:hypothetical protein